MSSGPLRQTYREMLSLARRLSRSEADARDLVQQALSIALRTGHVDWSSPERRAWLRGIVRKHAAFSIRSDQRRRRRESQAAAAGEAKVSRWRWQPEFLASLPRSLRVLAQLASADLCAAEIRWLLELSDVALRQRLSGLRKAVRACNAAPIVTVQEQAWTLPAPQPPGSFGAQRASVLTKLRQRGGRVIALSDPDGHVLFLKKDAHDRTARGNG